MKTVSSIVFILFATLAFGQKTIIDELDSKEAVENFIRQTDPKYQEFVLIDPQKMRSAKGRELADSLGIKTWVKTDFNNDGLTDLLVLGAVRRYTMLAVIAKTNGYRVEHLVPSKVTTCLIPVVQKQGKESGIVYYYSQNGFDPQTRKNYSRFLTDTLVYKNGSFLEYNAAPSSYKVEELLFQTTPCLNNCPVIEMTLKADGTAKYTDWAQKGKQFQGKIDEISFSEILELLDYIDFPSLQEKYENSGSNDNKNSTLKIVYNGEEKKRILDNGQQGTHGLSILYGYLYDLLETQEWTELTK